VVRGRAQPCLIVLRKLPGSIGGGAGRPINMCGCYRIVGHLEISVFSAGATSLLACFASIFMPHWRRVVSFAWQQLRAPSAGDVGAARTEVEAWSADGSPNTIPSKRIRTLAVAHSSFQFSIYFAIHMRTYSSRQVAIIIYNKSIYSTRCTTTLTRTDAQFVLQVESYSLALNSAISVCVPSPHPSSRRIGAISLDVPHRPSANQVNKATNMSTQPNNYTPSDQLI
jgi:hypothetical protein